MMLATRLRSALLRPARPAAALLAPRSFCTIPPSDRALVPYTSPEAIASARGPGGTVTVEPLVVHYGGFTYNSEVAYPKADRCRPIVLVFPNYAGKKAFDVDQATFLAMCGYTAVAVEERHPEIDSGYDREPHVGLGFLDVWDWHLVPAFHAMNSLRADVGLMRGLVHETLAAARGFGGHPDKAAAIGYCFGGQFALEGVRGGVDLDGVVTFHGLLETVPRLLAAPYVPHVRDDSYEIVESPANAYNTRCQILLEHGDLDAEVPQSSIDAFREEMGAAGCSWKLHTHGGVDHGFALPPTIISGWHFHERADRRSTLSMLALFEELWPEFPPQLVARNAANTLLR